MVRAINPKARTRGVSYALLVLLVSCTTPGGIEDSVKSMREPTMTYSAWKRSEALLKSLRHGYKRAIVAVAHRLCRVLFAMLRDGTDFEPRRMGIEEGAFTRTTTFKYRPTPKAPGRLPVN